MRIELDPEDLDRLAVVIADRVAELLREQKNEGDGWIGSTDAAAYLGISRNALHKLTSARQIPFRQTAAGGKCFFRRADLDRWRASSG